MFDNESHAVYEITFYFRLPPTGLVPPDLINPFTGRK